MRRRRKRKWTRKDERRRIRKGIDRMMDAYFYCVGSGTLSSL